MTNTYKSRLESCFGYNEDSTKYFNIFKEEFIKIYDNIRKDDPENIPEIHKLVTFKLDNSIFNLGVPSYCEFVIGEFKVNVVFNLHALDRRYSDTDHIEFNTKELFSRYLGCHEAVHVCTKCINEKLADENYGHGKFFIKYINKYRSNYTEVPFWTDGKHSNFNKSSRIFIGTNYFPNIRF